MLSDLEPRFLEDVKDHTMNVMLDNGLYRHLRFSKGFSSIYHFDIITWPHNLVITGDMGTYHFNRIEDMFKFFIIDKGDWNYSETGLPINPLYWAEKLRSYESNGLHCFSDKKIENALKYEFEAFKESVSDKNISEESFSDLYNEMLELTHCYNIHELYDSTNNFCHVLQTEKDEEIEFTFSSDFISGHNFNEYTIHYIWCLLAIVWGIKYYENEKRLT